MQRKPLAASRGVLQLNAGARLLHVKGCAQTGNASADDAIRSCGHVPEIFSVSALLRKVVQRGESVRPNRDCAHEQGESFKDSARKFHAAFAGELPEKNINIEQDLDVVADKANRLHKHAGVTASCNRVIVLTVDPAIPTDILALKSKVPGPIRNSRCDESTVSRFDLIGSPSAMVVRYAMRGKQHR